VIKFKDYFLNQPFIVPNGYENLEQHSQQGMTSTGKESCPAVSLFFFIFFLPTGRRQSINENQALQHPGPPIPGKPPYGIPH
jgi:hypothetical protein